MSDKDRQIDANEIRDGCNRTITYLRVSVTDRCNMRCVYCMPADAVFIPHEEMLSYEEIERVVRLGVGEGIRKVRITGGEPLARKNIERLIGSLSRLEGIEELSLTTNGLALAGKAETLAGLGLRRVNVSLDTLNAERFKSICRAGDIGLVMNGIRAAKGAGLRPVKVNVVVMRDRNSDEIGDFIDFSIRENVIVRFIEFMPFMKGSDWHERFVPRDEIIRSISGLLQPLSGGNEPNAPARYFRIKGTDLNVGFISPISHGFCSQCNRLRLTPDGQLLSCLLARNGIDVKNLLRRGAADEEIAEAFHRAAAEKGAKGAFPEATRHMHSIGG